VFLYKKVLKIELDKFDDISRPKRFEYIPVVLSRSEVKSILETLTWPCCQPIVWYWDENK